ncbi:MAG: prolipoprotein diacylglyceryl transferase family protein, partial [Christensenellales bacterium]
MAMYMLRYQCRKGGVPDKVYRTYLLLGVVSILVGFLSAQLFQSVYFWLETGEFEWRGLTFIGGLIGGIACFLLGKVLFIKGEASEYFGTICCYAIPCVLIAHAFGRIG